MNLTFDGAKATHSSVVYFNADEGTFTSTGLENLMWNKPALRNIQNPKFSWQGLPLRQLFFLVYINIHCYISCSLRLLICALCDSPIFQCFDLSVSVTCSVMRNHL